MIMMLIMAKIHDVIMANIQLTFMIMRMIIVHDMIVITTMVNVPDVIMMLIMTKMHDLITMIMLVIHINGVVIMMVAGLGKNSVNHKRMLMIIVGD